MHQNQELSLNVKVRKLFTLTKEISKGTTEGNKIIDILSANYLIVDDNFKSINFALPNVNVIKITDLESLGFMKETLDNLFQDLNKNQII